MMLTESGHVKSGFGNYTRSVLSRLHETNKYEIAELSCYRDHNIPYNEPWKVYPNVPIDPETLKEFHKVGSAAFGAWSFEAACIDFKPDIVFDIRDYWMLNFPEYSPLRPFFHWVLAPTIDSAPQKNDWIQTFANADLVSGHTQWGVDYLKQFSNLKLTTPFNDSVDENIFNILSLNTKSVKANLGLNPNDFIIGSVMRNQKRKLIPNLIKIVKEVHNTHPNVKLYLHTSYPDNAGWCLPELMLEYDAADLVYFSYKCRACNKMSAMTFRDGNAICPHCKKPAATICNVNVGLKDQELCAMYNSFDCYVQYAICEGFGIPVVEAASCGVPVITIDHGAMREIGDNIKARIVNLACVFRELETNAERVSPDDKHCVDQILEEYETQEKQSWLENIKYRKSKREELIKHYSWDKTAKDFEKVFDNIELTGLQGKWDSPPLPISDQTNINMNDMPSYRAIVYHVIQNVLKSPYLLSTHVIQSMIKNLDNGFVGEGGRISPYTMEQAGKLLDQFYNAKKTWDGVRTGQLKMPERFSEVLSYKK